jgi:excisionase family DNA binding protein
MTNTEHLIGTAEAAQVLGKSTRTIYRMVNAGTLTPAMIAPGGNVGTYLFDRADIEAFTAA